MVRQTINGVDHSFRKEQIINILNKTEKNRKRWDKCKNEYRNNIKDITYKT